VVAGDGERLFWWLSNDGVDTNGSEGARGIFRGGWLSIGSGGYGSLVCGGKSELRAPLLIGIFR
jgi:hypothetical protein